MINLLSYKTWQTLAGVFLGTSTLLGIVAYVQSLVIDSKTNKVNTLTVELSVSKESVKGLTVALDDVKQDLQAKEKDDLLKQQTIKTMLAVVEEQDVRLEYLSKTLKGRKSGTNCAVPKELQDAWTRL
jgi:hypothetical protein